MVPICKSDLISENFQNILQVAKRALTFLHNVIQELQILEIDCPAGSVACWVFLSILEVLFTCQKICDDSPQVKILQFFHETADLWSYARQKLYELGKNNQDRCRIGSNMDQTRPLFVFFRPLHKAITNINL